MKQTDENRKDERGTTRDTGNDKHRVGDKQGSKRREGEKGNN